jgi:hypothetical protein
MLFFFTQDAGFREALQQKCSAKERDLLTIKLSPPKISKAIRTAFATSTDNGLNELRVIQPDKKEDGEDFDDEQNDDEQNEGGGQRKRKRAERRQVDIGDRIIQIDNKEWTVEDIVDDLNEKDRNKVVRMATTETTEKMQVDSITKKEAKKILSFQTIREFLTNRKIYAEKKKLLVTLQGRYTHTTHHSICLSLIISF